MTSCKERYFLTNGRARDLGNENRGNQCTERKEEGPWQMRKEIDAINTYSSFIDGAICRNERNEINCPISKVRERRVGGTNNERISSENSSIPAKLGLTPRVSPQSGAININVHYWPLPHFLPISFLVWEWELAAVAMCMWTHSCWDRNLPLTNDAWSGVGSWEEWLKRKKKLCQCDQKSAGCATEKPGKAPWGEGCCFLVWSEGKFLCKATTWLRKTLALRIKIRHQKMAWRFKSAIPALERLRQGDQDSWGQLGPHGEYEAKFTIQPKTCLKIEKRWRTRGSCIPLR